MKGTSFASEEFFLRIFKFIILAVMALSLVVSIGALIYAATQYFQSPNEPEAAKVAPKETINARDFIDALKPKEKQQAPQEENKPTDEDEKSPKPASPPKFKAEAKRVAECLTEFAKKVGDEPPTDDLENLRQFFERRSERVAGGSEWVQESVKFLCEILGNEEVIALKKSTPGLEVFVPAVRFHANAWDKIQERIAQFDEREKQRIARERDEEETRVMLAKARAVGALMAVGIAFGVFMALALYLIFASIESNLRNINRTLESLTKPVAPDSEASAAEPTIPSTIQ